MILATVRFSYICCRREIDALRYISTGLNCNLLVKIYSICNVHKLM